MSERTERGPALGEVVERRLGVVLGGGKAFAGAALGQDFEALAGGEFLAQRLLLDRHARFGRGDRRGKFGVDGAASAAPYRKGQK